MGRISQQDCLFCATRFPFAIVSLLCMLTCIGGGALGVAQASSGSELPTASLPVEATTPDLTPNARSAILMAENGEVVYAKNAHAPLPPASITKIMTMLLVMEAQVSGRLKPTELIRTSDYAASMGGSQIFLQPGETMSVTDMLKGVAMASANDAAVALAEAIAGSEKQFVARMNERAAQLGMKNTRFQNVNGLPIADHYTSAQDIALMSKALLAHKPILTFTKSYQDYLRRDTKNPFWLVNTNKLIRVYDGADGLKTGYTREAQFCLAATAMRNGLRWIAVVMGEPSTKIRNAEVAALFDYGFSQFEQRTIIAKGAPLATVDISGGVKQKLVVIAPQAYTVLVPKGTQNPTITQQFIVEATPTAPITPRTLLGQLVITAGDSKMTHPIYATETITQATFWTRLRSIPNRLLHAF